MTRGFIDPQISWFGGEVVPLIEVTHEPFELPPILAYAGDLSFGEYVETRRDGETHTFYADVGEDAGYLPFIARVQAAFLESEGDAMVHYNPGGFEQ